jgi:hypothetical protein
MSNIYEYVKEVRLDSSRDPHQRSLIGSCWYSGTDFVVFSQHVAFLILYIGFILTSGFQTICSLGRKTSLTIALNC